MTQVFGWTKDIAALRKTQKRIVIALVCLAVVDVGIIVAVICG